MTRLRIALLAALAISVGCKSDLEKYQSYVSKACSCSDAACFEKVEKELEESIDVWEVMLEHTEEAVEPTSRMLRCRIRLTVETREKTRAELDFELLQDIVARMCDSSDLARAREIEAASEKIFGPEAMAAVKEELHFQTKVILDRRDACLRKLEGQRPSSP